jgi:mRNA-degrading endonuclease toxin of MazEF toxin-antitoxin module
VLIVSADEFNAAIGTPVVVPITTGGAFARNRGFSVSLAEAGTKTTGIVRCDQMRSIDLAARSARYLESVPEEIVDEVLARLAPIFT